MRGDQSAYADFGNAHTYFGTGNNPAWNNWSGTLDADAESTTPGRPVIVTETGFYTTGNSADPGTIDETVQAKYVLDDLMDSYKAGNPLTYLYELLDTCTGDGNPEDNFGLFHTDGTPKLAATAVHDLLALLDDPNGQGMTAGTLDYDLSGMQSTDNSLLMEKSDGTYWLALWNDTRLFGPRSPPNIAVPPQTITLNLGSAASSIQVFDPLTGTSAVQSFSNTSSAAISVPDHPVLVEITPSGAGSTPVSPAAGTTTTTAAPTPSATSPASGSATVTIDPNDASPVILGNDQTIQASAGDHLIFLGDTGNALTAIGGAETVQAAQGNNAITTGTAADTINFARSSNTIDAGGGNNTLNDTGSNNTIIRPIAGQGYHDVYGNVLTNGATLNLQSTLAQAGWNGDARTMDQYVLLSMNVNSTMISIASGGTSYQVATLENSGPVSLSTLLAHSIT